MIAFQNGEKPSPNNLTKVNSYNVTGAEVFFIVVGFIFLSNSLIFNLKFL